VVSSTPDTATRRRSPIDETSFGSLTPGGFFTEVTVGDRSFIISNSPCTGGENCRDAPGSVEILLTMLERIAEQYACGQ
jgi:hypothetical protein